MKRALSPEQQALLERSARRANFRLLADHELGAMAYDLGKKGIKPSRLAEAIKRPRTYVCNLARWWRRLPAPLREAWAAGHPALNHPTIDRLVQLPTEREMLDAWKLILAHREDGQVAPRRASMARLQDLALAIDAVPLTAEARELCLRIVRFALGLDGFVPGLNGPGEVPGCLLRAKV